MHFTNYYRWMEICEHEFLRSLGLSVDMEDENAFLGAIVLPEMEWSQITTFNRMVNKAGKEGRAAGDDEAAPAAARVWRGAEAVDAAGVLARLVEQLA